MASKYCTLCQRYIDPVKKKFSWGVFILCFGIFYLPYRILFVHKNRCPVCGTNKLISKGKHEKQEEAVLKSLNIL